MKSIIGKHLYKSSIKYGEIISEISILPADNNSGYVARVAVRDDDNYVAIYDVEDFAIVDSEGDAVFYKGITNG